MYLEKVSIKNYRSIKEIEIRFEPKCQILVGINESGKTNILRALSLLNPDATTSGRDIREPGRREGRITEAYVRFVLKLKPNEISNILEDLKGKLLSETHATPLLTRGTSKLTLDQFCRRLEAVYVADVLKGNKYATTWALDDYTLSKKWKKVAPSCPPTVTVEQESTRVSLKKFSLVDVEEFSELPPEYLTDASVKDFSAVLTNVVKEYVDANPLNVLFWDYDESNLLPPRINLDQFCLDPGDCIPLNRMFQLYGISDIKQAVTEAKAGSANGLNNLLRRVADKTSRHFHNTWREYDTINFSLTTDGPDVVARIEDKSNHYELSQRSDGFKRFVTFLLMVSAEDETNRLRDTLLLIDEPEIGLHPTGARYLMEELIDIARNNYVVFSTHSIFMVDSKAINRHLIVTKQNEISQIEQVSESNIQDEEVIYKSLGYSIFSNLKEKNLIFEGWRDKRLFEVALSRVPSEYQVIRELRRIGVCFAQGVKQIKNVTPLFEAGERKCLILSDGDAPAREHQKEYSQMRGYGTWKRYDELLPALKPVTSEDFIDSDLVKTIAKSLQEKYNLPEPPIDESSTKTGKLNAIKQWLGKGGVPNEEIPKCIEEVKEALFTELRPTHIRNEYYEYLKEVVRIVRRM